MPGSAFERIASELAQDGELMRLKKGGAPGRRGSPVVRMLGAFDNYNLGYVDRGFAVAPEHEKQIDPGGGIIRPSIVVDGRLVGDLDLEAKRRAAGGEIEPFSALSAEIETAVEAEVADLGRFEGLDATIPRP